jgi:two-component system OmpR family sensor kinase
MRTLTFKTRLWLGHVAVLAGDAGARGVRRGLGAPPVVMGRVIDDAILWLASTEAAALQVDPSQPVRLHELAPGAGPPSFTRLDKFVQITDLDGRVVERGATLGTARLPTPPALLRACATARRCSRRWPTSARSQSGWSHSR